MTDSERIIAVQKFSGLNFNQLAKYIGLNTVQSLYNIQRGKQGVSRAIADALVSKFPTLNKTWLLTGEGDMVLDDVHPLPSDHQEKAPEEQPITTTNEIDMDSLQAIKMLVESTMKMANAVIAANANLTSDITKLIHNNAQLVENAAAMQQGFNEDLREYRKFLFETKEAVERQREQVFDKIDSQTKETETILERNTISIVDKCKTLDFNAIKAIGQ